MQRAIGGATGRGPPALQPPPDPPAELTPWPAAFPAGPSQPSRGHDRLDLSVTIRSVHRPFEDRERQELGSPEERLQDSSDPDTGSEEEGGGRLSPPHSPRGEAGMEVCPSVHRTFGAIFGVVTGALGRDTDDTLPALYW